MIDADDEPVQSMGGLFEFGVDVDTTRDDLAAAIDSLVETGEVEIVPTCHVSLPPSFADLLTDVAWKPWDGDPRSLILYKYRSPT